MIIFFSDFFSQIVGARFWNKKKQATGLPADWDFKNSFCTQQSTTKSSADQVTGRPAVFFTSYITNL